jgi:hypothetical protein
MARVAAFGENSGNTGEASEEPTGCLDSRLCSSTPDEIEAGVRGLASRLSADGSPLIGGAPSAGSASGWDAAMAVRVGGLECAITYDGDRAADLTPRSCLIV